MPIYTLMKMLCRTLKRRIPEEDSPHVWELCEYYESFNLIEDHKYVIGDVEDKSKAVLVALYCVILTLGLLGNLAVIILYASIKSLRTVHTVFIFSLAASDLLVTLFCMPFNLVTVIQRTWNFGDLSDMTCKMVPFMESVAATANLLTLACIALDRYWAVLHPLEAKSFQTLRRAAIQTAIVWTAAILFAIPNLVYYSMIVIVNVEIAVAVPASRNHEDTLNTTLPESKGSSSSYLCYVSSSDLVPMTIYRWVFLGGVFLIPFLVMVVAYVRIGRRLWTRKADPIGCGTSNPPADCEVVGCAAQVRSRTSRRVIVLLVVILTLFFVSWTPTMLYEAIGLTLGLQTTTTFLLVRYYLQWFACSNACSNPILYVFLHDKLKRRIAQSRLRRYCCCCCGNIVQSNRIEPDPRGNDGATAAEGPPKTCDRAIPSCNQLEWI